MLNFLSFVLVSAYLSVVGLFLLISGRLRIFANIREVIHAFTSAPPLAKGDLPLSGFTHDRGYCHTVPVGRVRPSDAEGVSVLTVLEDGKPLPHPHAVHEDIVSSGNGAYAHWQGRIFLSASDNSDPANNGRTYAIRAGRPAVPERPRKVAAQAAGEGGAPVPLADKPHLNVLACPASGQPLHPEGEELVSEDGRHRYPVVRGILRFVASDAYVGSFSFEWNTHDRTQLDRYTGEDWSEKALRYKTGLRPEDVRGKLILDAGVGAGRFTDVLSRWGARVVGVDLSFAVEASQKHFAATPEVIIAQADIGNLPFREGTFDYIISIGVLHHTPDTRRYFQGLCPLLKPGGEIAIWVYPDEGFYAQRNAWLPFTCRIPPKMFYGFNRVFVPLMHRIPKVLLVGEVLRYIFPYSRQALGMENDILDTFDSYSPRYHGIHSPGEVMGWFREAGLEEVRSYFWHTSVRGRRPSAGAGGPAAEKGGAPGA